MGLFDGTDSGAPDMNSMLVQALLGGGGDGTAAAAQPKKSGNGVATALAQAIFQAKQDALMDSPSFLFGQGLSQSSAELGQDLGGDKPWLQKIVSALAGGLGQGLQQRGKRFATEAAAPRLKQAFALATDPQGSEKAYADPFFSQTTLPEALLGNQLQYAQTGVDRKAKIEDMAATERAKLGVQQEFGELESQKKQAERGFDLPKKNLDMESGLRKEFQGLAEVKDFVSSDIGYKSLLKAAQDNSPMADLELIRGAVQAIEPGMAVREGEQAAVAASASIPDQLKGAMSKALNGESGLTADQRQGILRIAERRWAEHSDKFNMAREFYRSRAENYNLLPESVTYLPEGSMPASAQNTPPPARTMPQATPTPAAQPVVGGLPSSIPTPTATPPETRSMNGVPYVRVAGGWQRAQ